MSGPHKTGDLIDGRYRITRFVGKGGMQYVYAAKDLVLDKVVAVKTPQNRSAEKRFKRSAVVAAKVNHPNVAKTLDYIEDDAGRYLVEEFIEGGDLDAELLSRVDFIDPYLAAKIFHHVAKGVAAAHHAGVVHRDLKPTNIMVSGGFGLSEIKVTDFGIAKMADEELIEAAEGGESSLAASQTAIGALPYMAPEAIESPREVGRPADIWSVGAMMYHLMTGETPYGAGLRAVSKIIEAEPPKFPPHLSQNPQMRPLADEIKGLILRCMVKEPADRLTADELVEECGRLCYPDVSRDVGVVREIKYSSWGFINKDGQDVFFNVASVYGKPVSPGEMVMFSSFLGGGADRAHPVVLLRK